MSDEMVELPDVEHPSWYIRHEMDKRDWGIPSMARAMGGDYGTNAFALEMYLDIGADTPGLRLGSMAADIAQAFGTSVDYWVRLEVAWLSNHVSTLSQFPDLIEVKEEG